MLKLINSIIFYVLLSTNAFADLLKVPPLNSRVTDLTQQLNAADVSTIEASLAELEKIKGSQVAVLMINSTLPEAIEDYSLRVVEKWKLGRADIDDGVLLLIALKDRKMRIEVGYGLEGTIPDIAAGRIIKEFITPEFRKGDIAAGIKAGTTQITNLIKGEPLPEPTTTQGNSKNDPGSLLFFLIFASTFISKFLATILGRLISVAVISVAGAAIIWVLTQNLLFTLIGTIFLCIFSFASSGSRSSSYRDGGGFGGGFGGGGSSGGGGFSGGGGGFGGGGASGGW